MASIVAEIMVEELASAVTAAETAGEISAETAAALAEESFTSELSENAISAYEEAAVNGEEAATQAAIDNGYSSIAEIDVDIANTWRLQVESSIEEGSDINPITNKPFSEIEIEDSPDVTEIEEGSEEWEDLQCPEGEGCKEVKENTLKKYYKFIKGNAGFLAAVGLAIYLGAAQLVGGVVTFFCRTFDCQSCKGDKSCCDKNCQTSSCNKVKEWIKFFRKYFLLIFLVSLGISVTAIRYFKSFTLLIILFLFNLFLVLLTGQLGNFIATFLCNEEASNCFFETGGLKC